VMTSFVELHRHSLVPVLTFVGCRIIYIYLEEKLRGRFGGISTDRHTAADYFLVSTWFVAVKCTS
jgi:hypothetical protein